MCEIHAKFLTFPFLIMPHVIIFMASFGEVMYQYLCSFEIEVLLLLLYFIDGTCSSYFVVVRLKHFFFYYVLYVNIEVITSTSFWMPFSESTRLALHMSKRCK